MFSIKELREFTYSELLEYAIHCQYIIDDLNETVSNLETKIKSNINKDFDDYRTMVADIFKETVRPKQYNYEDIKTPYQAREVLLQEVLNRASDEEFGSKALKYLMKLDKYIENKVVSLSSEEIDEFIKFLN